MKKNKPQGLEVGDAKPSRSDAPETEGILRLVERRPFPSAATGPPPAATPQTATPGNGHHGDGRKRKRRGRLNRAVLAMLGKGLEDCFDEVRKQEVPERFKLLLRQF